MVIDAAERGAFARGLPDRHLVARVIGPASAPGVVIASVEAPWRTLDAGAIDLGRRTRGVVVGGRRGRAEEPAAEACR